MRKSVIFFGFMLFCFWVGYGQNEQITQELRDFSEVKVFDGLSVNLIKSDVNRAVITGANTKNVTLVNNSGVLKLRMKINKMFSGYRTFIDLYYVNNIHIIDVNEDARIGCEQTIIQDVLDLRAQEGSEIVVNCQTEQLLVKAVSGGQVRTQGFSDTQDIIINTGGAYQGNEFKTKFTTVTVNAGGNASVYATDYVKANVKAGGKVLVYGDPLKMDEKTVFGGKIERIE